jgi:hypothetical protein
MMNVEEMPNWVPSTVKKLAVWFYGFDDDLVWRLVADPQMKSVWQYLLRRAQPVDSAIADDYSQLFLQLGVSQMDLPKQERACAIFFWFVVLELGVRRTAATRQDIANSVAPWRSAAEQCRLAFGSLGSGSANSELAKALSMSAKYFEFKARIAGEDANSPYTLKRSSGEPENNTVRGRVRALALISRELYGSFQYRILASVASVALQTNVTVRNVRNWCTDIPAAREETTAL